ncbi:MAG TPA: hypothetical protein VKW08_25550 [Xanthobacteraceae bacterium]|nr:hypothetical protein [Xanthobacteraceae bacterium]
MSNQLLQRQARLLEHLTGGAGIFGGARGLSNEPLLRGLDLGLLHLEARFSHEKRMQKIEWVLSHTLDLLGDKRAAIIRDFVEACPPASITWLDNARQFHAFLQSYWTREAAEPAWLPDVANYEIAYATVRAGERRSSLQNSTEAVSGAVRLHPSAVLLRCNYDIRCILDGGADQVPMQREIYLAVAILPGSDEPFVSTLSSPIIELLEMLTEFVNFTAFVDTPEVAHLLEELTDGGLIEVVP